jgi:DNA-damage-inducible protein D
MVSIDSGAQRSVEDYHLSRYACYLIAQNGDPRKKAVPCQSCTQRRRYHPSEYAAFQNYGYRGLYGGLDAKDIHDRKGLKPSQNILDHMGSTELAANLFRATQMDEKLRLDHIQGKEAANLAHYTVGQKVRQTISDLGGTMPEDLLLP